MALRLAMEYLQGDETARSRVEVLDGVRYALIGGPCPPWWAEVAYELRAIRREYREEVAVVSGTPPPTKYEPGDDEITVKVT